MRIFISYRRDDSAGYAGRIYDRLVKSFGRQSVFMDIDTIQPGEDFIKVIERAVGSCDITIVLIGRSWLDIQDNDGNRRIDNPNDFVRLEVSYALSREVRVIPVLIRGTSMPNEISLPDNLKSLARRHAIEVSDRNFHYDVDQLIETLKNVEAKPKENRIRKTKFHTLSPIVLSFFLLLLFASIGGYFLFTYKNQDKSNDQTNNPTNSPANTQQETPATLETSVAVINTQTPEQISTDDPTSTSTPTTPASTPTKHSTSTHTFTPSPTEKQPTATHTRTLPPTPNGTQEAFYSNGEMPETIIEALTNAGNFTAILTAFEVADMTEMLTGEGPYTVFAPSDEVLTALPPGTFEAVLADPQMLSDIFLYHIVEGVLSAEDLSGMTTLTAMNGKEITVTAGEDGVVALNFDNPIVITDIQTGNGVIHVIDGVLVP